MLSQQHQIRWARLRVDQEPAEGAGQNSLGESSATRKESPRVVLHAIIGDLHGSAASNIVHVRVCGWVCGVGGCTARVAVVLGRSGDVRDCGWELWGGWLHSQEWLCYKVKTSNRSRRRWRSSWTRASPWDERPVLP
jgi:hypothetical protein